MCEFEHIVSHNLFLDVHGERRTESCCLSKTKIYILQKRYRIEKNNVLITTLAHKRTLSAIRVDVLHQDECNKLTVTNVFRFFIPKYY